MLKRNGEPSGNETQDTLNRGERDAYNEAFDEIRQELEALERIKSAVQALTKDPSVFAVSGGGPEVGLVVQTQNSPIDRWQVCSTLLKFRNSQIFLCERSLQGAKEFAVIERFREDSPYAKANGEAEVLQVGNDPVLLVEEYAASAEHTLRGMASNLVARAHRIVWARYASTSPARVVQAISKECIRAASFGQSSSKEHNDLHAVQDFRQRRKQLACR
jgi:hypothetical protein